MGPGAKFNGSKLFPLKAVPYGMVNAISILGNFHLMSRIFILHVRNCVMGTGIHKNIVKVSNV